MNKLGAMAKTLGAVSVLMLTIPLTLSTALAKSGLGGGTYGGNMESTPSTSSNKDQARNQDKQQDRLKTQDQLQTQQQTRDRERLHSQSVLNRRDRNRERQRMIEQSRMRRHHEAQMRMRRRVRTLQEALNRHGASLRADGMMGPRTRAALSRFQRSHGLRATGTLNPETEARLGMR